jgi:hypothetical protein
MLQHRTLGMQCALKATLSLGFLLYIQIPGPSAPLMPAALLLDLLSAAAAAAAATAHNPSSSSNGGSSSSWCGRSCQRYHQQA